MEVNDIIKSKSGNLYTVQKIAKLGADQLEYLLLYEIKTSDLLIGYIKDNALEFVNDPQKRMAIAEAFDNK